MDTPKNSNSGSRKFHSKGLSQSQDVSLDQAIKKNDVKSFIRKGLSDIKNLTIEEYQKSDSLEDHLLQLKNSCSSIRQQIKNKEAETDKFRDETNFTTSKTKKMTDQKFDIKLKISELEKKLDQVNAKRDTAAHSCKTYQHILERMHKDDIFYQMKNNELNREIKQLKASLHLTEAKNYTTSEMEKLCMNGLKEAQQQLKKQKSLRQSKLENLSEQKNKIKEQRDKVKEQQKKTNKIRELADEMQDEELVRIKKFFTVQMFLKELLKSKMSRFKYHFQSYEEAFFQIKSRTSVKDANSLKSEFFNFESNYNQKTVWVKNIQEEIEQAKAETKQLQSRLLQLENDDLQICQKFEERETKQLKINKQEMIMKSLQHEFMWEKLRVWVEAQACKLKIGVNKQNDHSTLFIEILQKVKSEQAAVDTQQNQQTVQ